VISSFQSKKHLMNSFWFIFIYFFGLQVCLGVSAFASAPGATYQPHFSSCDPVSDPLKIALNEPSPLFCSQWNPDFFHNHQQCCGALPAHGRRKKFKACSQERVSHGFCHEMTPEQKEYIESVGSGKVSDVLSFLGDQQGRRGEQAFCTVNNGFLVNGRPIVPNPHNRIVIQTPNRCTYFGTDAMAGMLEWLGREVSKEFSGEEYSKGYLLLGDVAGPRGGCLFGSSGKRRHASHTTGQDADVGFLTLSPGQSSPLLFHRKFDVEKNWWFLKKILKNPMACVKVVFLGKEHIAHLNRKFSRTDPEWTTLQRFIRHMPGHSNHFHIRIGTGPGLLGCKPEAHPELEYEEDGDGFEAQEQTILGEIDRLKTRQSSSIEQ